MQYRTGTNYLNLALIDSYGHLLTLQFRFKPKLGCDAEV